MSDAGTAAATGDNGAAAQAAAAASAAAATAQKPWYDGQAPEFIGDAQNQGYDKKTPLDAAVGLHKSWREATQMISRLTGTPDKDRIIIRPKPDATPEEIAAFHEKLGRPAKSDDYDYKDVKSPDGKELDADTVAELRASAFKANLSKEQAASIAKDRAESAHKTAEAKATVDQAKLAEEIRAIEKAWGPNHDAHLFVAKQAMAKFGFTPEDVQAMQKVIGVSRIMEGFRKLGVSTGEARFIANQGPSGTGLMTSEQAKARMAELKQDRAWGDKLRKGDVAATAEFNALAEMMVTQDRSHA